MGNVILSLNPLLVSKKVLNNASLFVDTYSEMLKGSRGLFLRAKKYGVGVCVDLFPHCVIPQDYIINGLIDAGKHHNSVQVDYNNAVVKNDLNVIKSNHSGTALCNECKYKKNCPNFGTREINPIK